MCLWILNLLYFRLKRPSAVKRGGHVPQLENELRFAAKTKEERGKRGSILSRVFSGVWYSSSRFCWRMLTRSIIHAFVFASSYRGEEERPRTRGNRRGKWMMTADGDDRSPTNREIESDFWARHEDQPTTNTHHTHRTFRSEFPVCH